MSNSEKPTRRKRSFAWWFYAFLTIVCLTQIATFGFAAVGAAIICGLYSLYLFRGGRFVIFFF